MSVANPIGLGTLLSDYVEVSAAWAKQPIVGIAVDSRTVRSGDVFFAVRGGSRHGLDFLEAVESAGAAAVVWEPPYEKALETAPSKIPLIAIPQLRQKLGSIISRFYDDPSRKLQLIGITGTDGKTSCAHFIAQALGDAQRGPCGILGTLGGGVYGQTKPSLHTTPDSLAVQHWLAELANAHRPFAVMEVSSHALEQGRVNGVAFAVAVLTNLTRDHLDYHGTVEAYAAAKHRLFSEHQPKWAVLNFDDAFGCRLAADLPQQPVIGYGLGSRPETLTHYVWGEGLELTPAGLRLGIRSSWGEGEMHLRLLGRFNAANILATLATLLALGFPFVQALERVASTDAVAGRMQRLGGTNGQPLAVIDYAHTPHALEQALTALREHGGQRLWCVFGCGGDRDTGKRPLMGAVAEQLADRVIVTDDNPRTEDPDRIVRDIMAGMQHPTAATVIRDRSAAIAHALSAASPADIVLVAGKGHEDYQIIGEQRLPFSDHTVIQAYLTTSDYRDEAA